MSNTEVETWVKEWTVAVNDKLGLVPPRVLESLFGQFPMGPIVEWIVGEGVTDEDTLREWAGGEPALLTLIGGDEGGHLVREWASENEGFLKACRSFVRGLLRARGQGEQPIRWEFESLPNSGGIYRILLKGGQDEKGFHNNQGK